MADDVWSGFIIGSAGGGVAGLILWIVGRLNDYEIKWRATRAIASHTNLTEDRVRYLCSHHPKIVLSTGAKEMWGIAGRARDEDDIGVM